MVMPSVRGSYTREQTSLPDRAPDDVLDDRFDSTNGRSVMKIHASLFACLVVPTAFAFMACRTQSAGDAAPYPSRDTIANFDSVTLERTRCYGRCPAYRVTIHGDGKVEFQGMAFTAVGGRQEATLSGERIAELVGAINAAGYFALPYDSTITDCPTYRTDAPTAIVSVTSGDRSKKITHYQGCIDLGADGSPNGIIYPAPLTELERRIDSLVGTDRWVKGE